MKKTKTENVNIKELSLEELKLKESSLREELFNLKFQFTMGHLENTMRLNQIKKDIARVLTFASQKEKAESIAK